MVPGGIAAAWQNAKKPNGNKSARGSQKWVHGVPNLAQGTFFAKKKSENPKIRKLENPKIRKLENWKIEFLIIDATNRHVTTLPKKPFRGTS